MEKALIDLGILVIGTIFTTLLGVISMYIKNKINATDTQKEAMQTILEGMAKAENEIVTEAKKANEDGKLTKEEIAAAEKLAIDHALMIAKGPVKELLLTWGKDRIISLIKQLLSNIKK